MKKLENKTVFITGGLSGIGKACALAAAKEGVAITIAYRKSAAADKATEETKKLFLLSVMHGYLHRYRRPA